MSGPAWTHPEWALPLAVLCAAAAGVLGVGRLLAARRQARLLGLPRGSRVAGRAADAVLVLALLALAVALLGPRLGERTVRIPASGLDLVVLVDVSLSMEARDVPPSRALRARETARQALARMGAGDRAALAAFAGRGALLTPLTPDHAALAELADSLDADLMSDTGSELGAGLAAALQAFDPDSARPRVVLLLTDGEHAAHAPDDAFDALARADVHLVGVALGTEAGGPIPRRGGPLRDAGGEVVVTRRETDALAERVDAAGGELLRADAWGVVEDGALEGALRRHARPTPDGWIERRVRVARHGAPAALAFALLALEAAGAGSLLRGGGRAGRRRGARRDARPRGQERRRGRRVRRTTAVAASAALLLAADGTGPADPAARVRAAPDDARALVALGVARAEEGSLREAERAFLAAAVRAREPGLAALAYYDLGVSLLERGDPAGARDAFFDALALDPTDRRARFNLEWALRELERQPELGAGGSEEESDARREPSSDSSGEADEQGAPQPSAEEGGERRPAPAATEPSGADESAPVPELAPSEARRWMNAVADDPSRALRGAAREAQGGARASGPRW